MLFALFQAILAKLQPKISLKCLKCTGRGILKTNCSVRELLQSSITDHTLFQTTTTKNFTKTNGELSVKSRHKHRLWFTISAAVSAFIKDILFG